MEDPLDESKREVRLQWPAHAHGSELSQLSRDLSQLNLYILLNSLFRVELGLVDLDFRCSTILLGQ